ncbi:reverse transcriptase domain-containing protein [Tanacetum coccineum]
MDPWRMCIDFKILNSACPKDYYPLPSIDCKVKAVMGFKYKCFLDAYKGYHQIQMTREDEEKTAFYTEQGTYCYMKMPFGLKNAGATYQRLVDSTFQGQIGRNLEAYVDYMVIKSKDEKDLLADIAETFKNLKAINMNQGKPQKDKGHIGSHFPKNIEGDAKSQWKASFVKSVPGQVSRKGSPFLQHPQKHNKRKNKHEFHLWDPGGRGGFSADEEADNIPSIINTALSEGDTVCIPSSGKGGCLSSTADRSKRKTMPSPVYFLSDAPDGEAEEEYFRMPEVPPEVDDTKVWTLFTEGAASLKGSGAAEYEASTSQSVTHCKKNEGVRYRGEEDRAAYDLQDLLGAVSRGEEFDGGGRGGDVGGGGMDTHNREASSSTEVDQDQAEGKGADWKEEKNLHIREAKYKTQDEQYYNKRVPTSDSGPLEEFVYRRNEASDGG